MAHLIDKDALIAEIKRRINGINLDTIEDWRYRLQWEHDIEVMKNILSFIGTLEVKEVDFEKESELIANGIMISVQSNKYGTNIYNTERNDFNHYHLQMAARKGIELGIKVAQKEE